MKLLKRVITPAIIAFIMLANTSCEGTTNREWKVSNNSSSAIHVEMETFGTNLQIQSITPGETKTATIYNSNRGAKPSLSATQDITLFLLYNDSDTSNKSGTDEENWVTVSEKTKIAPAAYTYDFTYLVSDNDF